MKKIALLILAAAVSGFAADCPIKKHCSVQKFNELEVGTISGRVQSLTMVRDYADNGLGNGANSSLALELRYLSPEIAGFEAGLTYDVSAEFWKKNNSGLLLNDNINVLNEAWLRYRITTNTSVTVGRKINNGEVFRDNAFRHKARAIEAVQLDINEFENLKLSMGHALRMSNWLQTGDRWDFNDFGDVFGAGQNTDGITWGELVYTGVENLEIALFDALAYDVAYLIGTRVEWNVATNRTLIGYYRHETDVGDAEDGDSDAFGISFRQKIGRLTLEPGYFGVRGDNLHFQEATTGINHPLGATMMLYASQFNGGADVAYLKATTKIGKTKLYALYNHTWHSKTPYDGQELNVVITQPICDNLTVAFKGGLGHRELSGGGDTTATDVRLFVTYTF